MPGSGQCSLWWQEIGICLGQIIHKSLRRLATLMTGATPTCHSWHCSPCVSLIVNPPVPCVSLSVNPTVPWLGCSWCLWTIKLSPPLLSTWWMLCSLKHCSVLHLFIYLLDVLFTEALLCSSTSLLWSGCIFLLPAHFLHSPDLPNSVNNCIVIIGIIK